MSSNKIELPDEKFDVIYADPPWKYNFSISKNRDIENHYPTMNLDEIKEIDVPSICNDNAVLYLWATAPKMKEALELMESWGFEYKTHMIWNKIEIGCGWWFRGQHELLLVGIKGKMSPPDEALRVPSVYSKIRRRHSAKPSYFRIKITQWFPDAKKIELFARGVFKGWAVWGNEAGKRGLLKRIK